MGFTGILKLIRNGDFTQAKAQLLDYLDNDEIHEDDISLVLNYYTSSKSPYAGYVLYRMQCAKKLFFEAYTTYMDILKQSQGTKKDVWFSDVTYNATDEEIDRICADISERLEGDIDIPLSILIAEVIDEIVPVLWRRDGDNKYQMIADLAEKIWFGELKTSDNLYEFAYSCDKVGNDLAEKLYLKLIEKEPANSEALNSMGLMYEKRADLEKAKLYYGRAHQFCSSKDIYKINYERVSV